MFTTCTISIHAQRFICYDQVMAVAEFNKAHCGLATGLYCIYIFDEAKFLSWKVLLFLLNYSTNLHTLELGSKEICTQDYMNPSFLMLICFIKACLNFPAYVNR